MNPSQIGERTEVTVMAGLVHAGELVVVPYGDRHRFDLAFARGARILTVPCKTGRERNGVVAFYTCNSTRSGEKRHYRADVDFFGVFCESKS